MAVSERGDRERSLFRVKLCLIALVAAVVGVVIGVVANKPASEAQKVVSSLASVDSGHADGAVGYEVKGMTSESGSVDIQFWFEGDHAKLSYVVGSPGDEEYDTGTTYLEGTTRYDVMGGVSVGDMFGSVSSSTSDNSGRRKDDVYDFRKVLGAMYGAVYEAAEDADVSHEGYYTKVTMSDEGVRRLKSGLLSRLYDAKDAEGTLFGLFITGMDPDVVGVELYFADSDGSLAGVVVTYEPEVDETHSLVRAMTVSFDVDGLGETKAERVPDETRAAIDKFSDASS